jgi:hypothetical protein
MVVAMLALFVAIGGTALALPGRNKVNSGDVRNETLLSEDLRDGQAVHSSDVIEGTLQVGDYGSDSVQSGVIEEEAVLNQHLATSAVTADKITTGSVGSDELPTPTKVVDATPFDFPDQDEGNNDYSYGSSTADCPGGSEVIAGGGEWVGAGNGGTGGDELQAITQSGPSGGGSSWTATAVSDVDNQDFQAVAWCIGAGVSSP